jgi:hypothetical protein
MAALRTGRPDTTGPQPATDGFTDPLPDTCDIAALRTGGHDITGPQPGTDGFTDLRPDARDITELPHDICDIAADVRPNTANTTDSPTGIRTIVSLRIDTRNVADLRIRPFEFAEKSRADPRPTLGATALFQSTVVKPQMGDPPQICGQLVRLWMGCLTIAGVCGGGWAAALSGRGCYRDQELGSAELLV